MKKKILFFALIAVAGAVWAVAANKFENAVRTVYLPNLKLYKERGWFDVNPDEVEIQKYKFKVIAKNFIVFPTSEIFITKFDEISACYNPLNNKIKLYSSGKKISMALGGIESYTLNSSNTIVIPASLLDGDSNDFDITLQSGPAEIFRSSDNALLLSSKSSEIKMKGKFDEATNQYSGKIEAESKGVVATKDYVKWAGDLQEKLYPKLSAMARGSAIFGERDKALEEIIWEINSIDLAQEADTALKFSFGVRGRPLKSFDIHKDPFDLSGGISQRTDWGSIKASVDLSGNGKDIKGDISYAVNSDYPKEEIPQIISSLSESAVKLFNYTSKERAKRESQAGSGKGRVLIPDLSAEDLKGMIQEIIKIKNLNFNASAVYGLQDKDTKGSLHLAVNEHSMDLTLSDNDKEVSGVLKFSDPSKILNSGISLARVAILPIAQKILADNVAGLSRFEKNIANVEARGLDALKVLAKNPDLKEGEQFESAFNFKKDENQFKVNDKTVLQIITDDKIVAFLKGFTEEEAAAAGSVQPLPSSAAPAAPISDQSKVPPVASDSSTGSQ